MARYNRGQPTREGQTQEEKEASLWPVNLPASPRATQIEAWWQQRDANEDLLRGVSDIVGGSDLSNDAIAEAVKAQLADSTIIEEGVISAFDNDSRIGKRAVRDAIKEEVGDAIAAAFEKLPESGLGEELRANQAEGIRRSFKEDPTLRESLRELIREELTAALAAAPRAASASAAAPLPQSYTVRPEHNTARMLNARPLGWAIRPKLHGLKHEEFWTITLNARLQIIGMHQISKGGLSQCSVTAREAFAPAFADSAPCVAFVHNHPSGDVSPSAADLRLFLLLDDAARTLGIRGIDHLILSDSSFYSHVEGEILFESAPSAPLSDI